MGEDAQAIRQEIAATRGRMGETVEAIGYRADVKARTTQRLRAKINAARVKVGIGTAQVASVAPSGADMRDTAGRAVSVAEENPLGLAVGAVAVGFLAGLLVPATRVENEQLGPLVDEVREQALHTGQEALEHGRQIAADIVQGATAAAHEGGQQLVEDLKASAQESAQEIKDARP